MSAATGSRRAIVLIWRSIFGVLLLGSLQVAGAMAGGIQLQYSHKVGDKTHYKLKMEGGITEFAGKQNRSATLATEMTVTQEIVEAAAGIATLKTHVDHARAHTNGEEVPLAAAGQDLLTRIRLNGDVVDTPGFEGLSMKGMQVVFPDRALAVNDSWSVTIPPANGVPVPLTVRYQIVGMKRIGNEDCVKILSSVQSDRRTIVAGLMVDVKSEGEMYFAYRSGRMIKNEMRSRSNLIRTSASGADADRFITRVSNHMSMEYVP
jgi:hypothetical protein